MKREESQKAINDKNSEFWSEPCGTWLSNSLGLEAGIEANQAYDTSYFKFYPYLKKYLKVGKGEEVLEIGLGSGTVSEYLMQKEVIPTFLDIAPGAIAKVKSRAELIGFEGASFCNESILDTSLIGKRKFDKIIAIGSLHHTGNLAKAIDVCYELLKDGGILIFMVYNAYSRRQIKKEMKTLFLSYLKNEYFGEVKIFFGNQNENLAYDEDTKGEAAPCTQFVSLKAIERLCSKFSKRSFTIENLSENACKKYGSRDRGLLSWEARNFGTDIYGVCKK